MKYKNNLVYERVKLSLAERPSEEIASMRVAIVKPSFLDYMRKRLQTNSVINITHKDWYYGIFYGEKELFELLRQLL